MVGVDLGGFWRSQSARRCPPPPPQTNSVPYMLRDCHFEQVTRKKTKNMKKQIINRLLDGAIVVTLLAAMTQSASASIRLPDAASTSSLVGVVFVGLVSIRRYLR